MSKYLPYKALQRESNQQAKRLANGLKTGFYVRYPDPVKGPHVVRASKLPELNELNPPAHVLELDKTESEQKNENK